MLDILSDRPARKCARLSVLAAIANSCSLRQWTDVVPGVYSTALISYCTIGLIDKCCDSASCCMLPWTSMLTAARQQTKALCEGSQDTSRQGLPDNHRHWLPDNHGHWRLQLAHGFLGLGAQFLF